MIIMKTLDQIVETTRELERGRTLGHDNKNKILDGQVLIRDCGRMEYAQALALQESLRDLRMKDQIPDTVLLVEHDSVYTIGKDIVEDSALIRQLPPAPIVHVNRGGKITYHGPGQLVGYCILKIPLVEIGTIVDGIEDFNIGIAQQYGIRAYSRKQEKDAYGKYIRGAWCTIDGVHKKIAAQGLETKNAGMNKTGQKMIVTMHGFALNVNTDLGFFKYINPCGFAYDAITSMEEVLGKHLPFRFVKEYCSREMESFLNDLPRAYNVKTYPETESEKRCIV